MTRIVDFFVVLICFASYDLCCVLMLLILCISFHFVAPLLSFCHCGEVCFELKSWNSLIGLQETT